MTTANTITPHPCQWCGQPTIYATCDACQTALFREALQLAQASTMMPAPPSVSAAFAAMGQRTLDEVVSLTDVDEIGGPLDGDEFRATAMAVEALPVTTPPAPREWSGLCLTCLREQRERGVEVTAPELSRIQPCRRHLRGAHALARFLRGETLYDLFTEAFGFGPDGRDGRDGRDGERREKGGAA